MSQIETVLRFEEVISLSIIRVSLGCRGDVGVFTGAQTVSGVITVIVRGGVYIANGVSFTLNHINLLHFILPVERITLVSNYTISANVDSTFTEHYGKYLRFE